MIATIIFIVLAWDPAAMPQLNCPVDHYVVRDCLEDLCHPEECNDAAIVLAGKFTATIEIDDSVTHVFSVTAIGTCGHVSRPSNQVFWVPDPMALEMEPLNLRYGP